MSDSTENPLDTENLLDIENLLDTENPLDNKLRNDIKYIQDNINIDSLYNKFLSNPNEKIVTIGDNDKRQGIYFSLLKKDYINVTFTEDIFQPERYFYNTFYIANLDTFNTVNINNTITGINLSKYYNNKINIYNLYFDFLLQFYKEITFYLENNYKLDENIYEYEFTFKTIYGFGLLDNALNINNDTIILKYNLNKNNILRKNVNGELINIISWQENDAAKNAFTYLLNNIDKNHLFKQIDIINTNESWRRNPYAYLEFEKKNLIFQYILLQILYKYILKNHNNRLTILDDLANNFNTIVSNNRKELSIINTNVNSVFDEKKNDSLTESQQIKNVLNRTNELKQINNNLNIKTNKIKNMNTKIEEQQNKLTKINIVLIIAIIIFIFLVICLILNKYIDNKTIYISSGIISLVSLIIYIYIYNLKKTAYYVAENFLNQNKVVIDQNIKLYIEECDNIKIKSISLNHSYYDIINPLLNIELKNYREKSNNTKIYDKMASFNVNIGQRDIKFTIETIQYLINLSILFVFLLSIIKIQSNIKYIIIVISFIIFIILTALYFVKIVRVVRTKSNNYYWDKPKPLNKKN